MAKNKTFFGDFKTFIARGNVVDMAVGVIVGGAFTTIVNSLSNNVLRPLINWILVLILGKDSLSEVYTFLQVAYKIDENGEEVLDLAESIYIDWGAFINAIINFFIIALVLFVIVRTINNLRGINVGIRETADRLIIDKKEIAELKEHGIDLKNRKAIQAYFEEKARLEKEAAEKAKAEAEEKSIAERAANPTSEELLKEIRDILKNK
ncbi:MAG: large conductance mechanosensitive channel protein MscL [Clostridia bacterium]|nr:large conductance mechanosensitive channel protein MscL [Clostridia bacterium]